MKEAFVVTTIILQLIAVGNAIITTPPTDTSVCYGGLATFQCGSDRNDIANIQWHINPDDLSLQERGISIDTNIASEYATTTLSIIGLPVNDGIDIVCTAVTSSFDTDSVPATLTVSDIPPVEDLNIEFNDTAMNVSWSEPSCLPVNYTYSIAITDDNNRQTPTTNLTTDPLYIMPVWSPCTTNYTVSVTVVDTGYTHNQSVPSVGNMTKNNTEELDVELLEGDSELVFSNPYESYVNVTFKIIRKCNESSVYDDFVVNVQPVNDTRTIPLLEYADKKTNHGIYRTNDFHERFIGKLSISPAANIGRVSSIYFSTYNVQKLNVTNGIYNGSIVITCVFATNSFATGCYVTIQSSQYNASIVIQRNIYDKTATKEAVLREEGLYNFQAFDIVDGNISTSAAVDISETIFYSNVNNPSESNDNYSSNTLTEIAKSTSTVNFSARPSSSVVVSEAEKSTDNTAIIAGVLSSIFAIVILLVIVSVVFLTFVRQKKNKQGYETRKGQAEVRNNRADKNEYDERGMFAQVPDSVSTFDPAPLTEQNGTDYNPYHVPINDFLHHAISPARIVRPLASNQERHSENFEPVVNQDSNFSSDSQNYDRSSCSTTSISISTSSDPTQSEPKKQHIFSNTKSSKSTSPYENIPPKHRQVSSDSATDQQSTIPAGPMLIKSQYAELASNMQRPKPPISDPPPVYATIIPADNTVKMTMNSFQLQEKKEPIAVAMQETQHDRNSATIGLPINLDSYNGMIFAGSVASMTEDDYSHNTATAVFIENEEEQELSVHQRITCPADNEECDKRDGLVPNTPNSSGSQMITQSFQSSFLHTYQKETRISSYIWDDPLHVTNDTDIRVVDRTECYSDVDASHSQMVYLLNNDYVKSRKSSDLVVFCRSCTIFEDVVVEDHKCIEVVSIGVKDTYLEEEESKRNVTISTAAFKKQNPSVCEFIQWTLALLTCIVFKLKSFFHQGYVFDGGGKKDKIWFSTFVKEFQLLVFDGGGLFSVQNYYWWYVLQKLLYDKAVKSVSLACSCLFLFLLVSAVYFHLFNVLCCCCFSSKISPSSLMIIFKIFKKRKKKLDTGNHQQ